MKSRINIELEVIQPDWDRVRAFLEEHLGCNIELWFHSVAQCNGKFKLYLQMYCDKHHAKLIPFNFYDSSEQKVKEE